MSRVLHGVGLLLLLAGGCRKAEPAAAPPPDKRIYQLELIADEGESSGVYTQYPNYINMIARVTNGRITTTDRDGKVVPDFSNPDYYVTGLTAASGSKGNFSILENGVAVEAGLRVQSVEETLRLHVNLLLDVSGSVGDAGLLQAKNAAKRLVARPCTPNEEQARPSPCFSYAYQAWDPSTKTATPRKEKWRSVLKENQVVNLYTFSDTVRRIDLRQTDDQDRRYSDKARQVLDTIDQAVVLGVDSTNLYGAFLAGLDDLRRVRSLGSPTKGLVDGMVVAFTDGSHTSGDVVHRGETLSPTQAIARIRKLRGSRSDLRSLRVVTIAVESPELQESILSGDLAGGGVRDLQNAGYLRVKNFGQLHGKFDEAFALIDRYASSMYRIYYRSPKTGTQTVNIDLRVTCGRCERTADGAIPDYATAAVSVETNGFYQVPPGVYINDPLLDKAGKPDRVGLGDAALVGPEALTVRPRSPLPEAMQSVQALVMANHPQQAIQSAANTDVLRLHTYVRANDNRFRPEYSVVSSDESVVAVRGVGHLTVIESVAVIECLKKGSATISVTDTANGRLQDSIAVTCAVDAK